MNWDKAQSFCTPGNQWRNTLINAHVPFIQILIIRNFNIILLPSCIISAATSAVLVGSHATSERDNVDNNNNDYKYMYCTSLKHTQTHETNGLII